MANKFKIFALISAVIIILGPILGVTLNKITLYDKNVLISTNSSSNIQEAFDFPFTLTKDQKLTIEFSVNTRNVSATLKILTSSAWETANDSGTDPDFITGEDFTYSQFAYGQSPSSLTNPTTSRSISENGYWYCEFAGDTSGDYLISQPGDYVVVVYGSNSQAPTWTNVTFNIKLRIDGPGEFLGGLFITIGVSALVATMLLAAFSYLKKTRRALL
jgi:hypothetical protein